MTKKEQLKSPLKKPRVRKCLNCKEYFQPKQQGETTCSVDCAILHGKSNFTKQAKRKKAQAKKDHYENDKATLMKKAQFQFNKYIRLRDKKDGCISCGDTNRQRHAGHYRPVGRNGKLRFDESNCHSQCSICNNHLSGNLVMYRENLIQKIGISEVERLEADNEPHKYNIEELKQIIEKYKSKIKALDE